MKAYLYLANGLVLEGQSVGAAGTTIGEVVFHTGMVGFQESFTDPACSGQILVQTYPMIGNYGFNHQDYESDAVHCRGVIMREACEAPSNWRCEMNLDAFLKKHNAIGIQGIDTRRLTRLIRGTGVINGAITTEVAPGDTAAVEKLMAELKAYKVTGAVAAVTCAEPQVLKPEGELHVAVLDLGVRRSVLHSLTRRGCKLTVLPAGTSAEEIRALGADGLLITDGPGDPNEYTAIAAELKKLLDEGMPAFGMGMGHGLAALAAGAQVEKMKCGHHGANQPVYYFATGRTYITCQNHCYVVKGDTLPAEMGAVSAVNANDKSCEAVDYTAWNCFTVQFQPADKGGLKLFDRFVEAMKAAKKGEC